MLLNVTLVRNYDLFKIYDLWFKLVLKINNNIKKYLCIVVT